MQFTCITIGGIDYGKRVAPIIKHPVGLFAEILMTAVVVRSLRDRTSSDEHIPVDQIQLFEDCAVLIPSRGAPVQIRCGELYVELPLTDF